MTEYQERKGIILADFLRHLEKNGHRSETIAFVNRIAGFEIDRYQFIAAYKEAVKVRCSKSKANGFFNYLVDCGIIRSNER
jgi:hypothetical protein